MKKLAFITFLFASYYASATTRYWVGTTSSNWNLSTNWNTTSGGGGASGIPTAGDDIVFDGNGLHDCTVTLSITCKTLTVLAAYTKTITQATGFTITINGASIWSGGVFTGGNSNIINKGTFTLSGSAFTSTSGTLSVGNNFSFTSGSFAHNSGTVSFDQSLSFTSITVSNSSALTFNHVTAVSYYATTTFSNGPLINGNLTLNGAAAASQTIGISSSIIINGNLSIITSSGGNQTISFSSSAISATVNGSLSVTGAGTAIINTGKINANGDVTYSNTSTTAGGSGTLNISGSGTQTLTGSGTFNQGNLPNVTINSTGTLNLASYMTCTSGWTYTSGTINPGTSTVCFYNTGTAFTIAGTHTLNNAIFYGSYSTFTINNDLTVKNLTFDSNTNGLTTTINSSITATGSFTMQGSSYIISNTGTINVAGDITNTNSSASSGGTATININGTSTQTLTAPTTLGQGSFPNISINKTGTLNLVNYITCGGTSWILTSGTISPGTSTVNFYNTGSSTFTVSGTQTLNNVIFYGNYATTTHTVSNDLTTNNLTLDATNTCVLGISSAINVNGTLTYSGSGNIRLNSGTINVKGDVVNNNTNTGNGGGTASFIINGTGTQTITGTAAADQGAFPPFSISKTSGTLNLSGFITLYNGFTWVAGTVNPGTSTCVFYNAVSASQSITTGATVMNFYNVLFEQPDYLQTSLATDISVLGSITIAAACGVNTNGHKISIGGDFICLNTTSGGGSSAFNPGVGTVTFNGTGLQTITMNNPSASTSLAYFYKLVINNTAARSTNDDITLTGVLPVTNGVTFTNGRMLTTSTNYLYLRNGASANIGAATTYVNGPMRYDMALNGSRTLNFPIGDGSNWRYCVLNLKHNTVTSYTYAAQVTHASAGLLGYTLPATIERVSGVRYTTIDRTQTSNGTSQPSAGLNGNQVITMYYDTDDQVNNFANLTIAKTTGSGSPWVDIGGTATANTTGTIVSTSAPTAFASFSKFSVANKVTGTNSLPIKLVSFDATLIGKKIQLTWQTATEINNDHFELMRSKDGIEWETLETIKAAGNSTVLHNYSAEDVNPLQGTSFYRLRQIDFDGQFQNYTISVESAVSSIAIYPNPASSQVTIEGENLNLQDLKIFNLLGNEVTSNLRLIQSDKNKMVIDISLLPYQAYIFKIKNASSIIFKQEPVLNSQR